MYRLNSIAMAALVLTSTTVWGANPKASSALDKLGQIRARVLQAESELIQSVDSQSEAKSQMAKIQTLLRLQLQEGVLSQTRMHELEKGLADLEVRKGELKERIVRSQGEIRQRLNQWLVAQNKAPSHLRLDVEEKHEAPKRMLIGKLAERNIKSLEELKIDLEDAAQIEAQISQEQAQMAYVIQDLRERRAVLELNQKIQLDIIQKKHAERIVQLKRYRELKGNQARVEDLLSQFNARQELERSLQKENHSAFMALRGRLKFPIDGSLVGQFGPSYDPISQLQIFKKGIEIAPSKSGQKLPVKAVWKGKVVFSGELAEYGKVAILDHGDHFYSLAAHLGELSKSAGTMVEAGETIGGSQESGTPVYFEIRARNIAVNPLQWVSR